MLKKPLPRRQPSIAQTAAPTAERTESQQRTIDLTVVHEDGAPAVGASLRVLGAGGESPLITDGKGFRRLLLTRPTSEAALYIVSADGQEEALPCIIFTGPLATRKVVLHRRGARPDTVSISGRVVDAQGRAVGGAELWVLGLDSQRGGMVFLSRPKRHECGRHVLDRDPTPRHRQRVLGRRVD